MDLNTFLKTALANKETVDVGQFHLLNLDAVKEMAGGDWPNKRKKIFDVSTHFIEKRISPDDLLMPCAEGFLLIFADAGKDSDEEIEQISKALQIFFMGAPDLKTLEVSWQSDTVTAKELVELAAPSQAEPEKAPVEEQKASPAPSKAKPGFKSCFRPIWDAQNQSIAFNRCFTKYEVADRLIDGRRVIQMRMADISHDELDETTATTSLDVFKLFFKNNKQISLCLSVHASTLSTTESLSAYLEPFRAIPEASRKSIIFKIDDLPHNAPASVELLTELKKFGARTIVEVPFGTTDLSLYKSCGVSIFSSIPPKPVNEDSLRLNEPACRALKEFVQAANAMQAQTLLSDVRDLKTLKSGMDCGVRFFSGDSVVADGQKPLPKRPLSMVDLCRINKAA